MKMAITALTKNGVALACKIGVGFDADLYGPASVIANRGS